MDTQHTATVQTILNEPLERYHLLYSEYLEMILKIHNYNIKFLEFKMFRASDGRRLRGLFKKMRALQTELWRACNEADQMHWTLHPPARGRPFLAVTKYPRRKKHDGPVKMGRPRKIKDVDLPKSNSGDDS